MSLLNLDEEKEERERKERLARQPEIEAEQNSKEIWAFVLIGLGIGGFIIGWWSGGEKETSNKIATGIAAVLGFSFFSGIVALIVKQFTNRGRMAFVITFLLLSIATVATTIRRQQIEESKPKPIPIPKITRQQ